MLRSSSFILPHPHILQSCNAAAFCTFNKDADATEAGASSDRDLPLLLLTFASEMKRNKACLMSEDREDLYAMKSMRKLALCHQFNKTVFGYDAVQDQ